MPLAFKHVRHGKAQRAAERKLAVIITSALAGFRSASLLSLKIP